MAEPGRDHKFFQYASVEELHADLTADKRDKGYARKKATLKKIIANATMGNDMAPLFPEVVECIEIPAVDIKKMVCTYRVSPRFVPRELRKIKRSVPPGMRPGVPHRLR